MGASRHFLVIAACACACVAAVTAQYGEGPLPPRLVIPGAIPVSGPPQRSGGVLRQRRPLQLAPPSARQLQQQQRQQQQPQAYLPTPTNDAPTPPSQPRPLPPTTQQPPRPPPVEEDPEEYDEQETDTPRPLLATTAPAPPPSFRSARPQIRVNDTPPQYRQPALQQPPSRAAQRTLVQQSRPNPADAPRQPPPQQQPLFRQQAGPRPVPAFRPERPVQLAPEPLPQITENSLVQREYGRQQQRPSEQQPQVRQQQQQQRPIAREPSAQPPRYKPQRANQKPVAQVLNRFREELPDGSITWGYENDDGSFKEETIGANCIVSGKYGYVDPDGVRREYTYSSGILCDKTKEAEEEKDEGYMDYQNNAYVLPNGQSVDLNQFSKNKSRRPVPNYGK